MVEHTESSDMHSVYTDFPGKNETHSQHTTLLPSKILFVCVCQLTFGLLMAYIYTLECESVVSSDFYAKLIELEFVKSV